MNRYEALPDTDGTLNEIEDLIWKTFTLDHIPPAFTVELRRILAGLATDQRAVSECERLRVFERAFAKVPQEQQARIMDAVRADAAAEGQYTAKEYAAQSRWVVGGCYEDNRLRLIEGRALGMHEQLTLVEASE